MLRNCFAILWLLRNWSARMRPGWKIGWLARSDGSDSVFVCVHRTLGTLLNVHHRFLIGRFGIGCKLVQIFLQNITLIVPTEAFFGFQTSDEGEDFRCVHHDGCRVQSDILSINLNLASYVPIAPASAFIRD